MTFEEKDIEDPLEGQETHFDGFINGQRTGNHAQPRMDVDSVVALRLQFIPFYVDYNEGPCHIQGLLLQSTGMAKGQFTRCSVFDI
jgi:hypothetical protein